MQRTFEYGVNNRVSPATLELLIRERSKGKTLRQLAQMFGKSHEKIRQLLTKYSPSQETLLPESTVTARLGCPVEWLRRLRKDGIVNPIKRGYWLYSEEQVRQIPSLIAETRKCQECGKPCPPVFHKFCRECSQHRKKHWYECLSLEAKAERIEKVIAWRKANPERWNEIQSRARRKFRASHRNR